MACTSCGRELAAGAQRCVFCGAGAGFRPKAQLDIPQGAVSRRSGGFPWGRLLFFLLAAGAVAAAFLHPEINARIRSLIPF